MELWIRNQNKENLINVKNITVSHKYSEKQAQEKYLLPSGNFEWRTVYKKDKYIKSIISGDDYWLGEYKSKERALEVLDEIQNILQPSANFIVSKHIDFADSQEGLIGVNVLKEEPKIERISDIIVYEMPKE